MSLCIYTCSQVATSKPLTNWCPSCTIKGYKGKSGKRTIRPLSEDNNIFCVLCNSGICILGRTLLWRNPITWYLNQFHFSCQHGFVTNMTKKFSSSWTWHGCMSTILYQTGAESELRISCADILFVTIKNFWQTTLGKDALKNLNGMQKLSKPSKWVHWSILKNVKQLIC